MTPCRNHNEGRCAYNPGHKGVNYPFQQGLVLIHPFYRPVSNELLSSFLATLVKPVQHHAWTDLGGHLAQLPPAELLRHLADRLSSHLLAQRSRQKSGGKTQGTHEEGIAGCLYSGRHGPVDVHQLVRLFSGSSGRKNALVYIVSLHRHREPESERGCRNQPTGPTRNLAKRHYAQRG